MPLTPGARLGPYEILDPIGAGGMGEVYRARDTRINRFVAIKVLRDGLASDPERRGRFEREARAVGQLNHPNIMVLHDVGDYQGAPYLVCELLAGQTLRQRLVEGPLPPRRALDCARQIALGLAAAHENGVVHCDLKPDNILLARDGILKILDFGLARLSPSPCPAGSVEGLATLSLAGGGVVGTPGYMAPEQVREKTVDQRADLFALGAILYEMVTGRRAFQGSSPADTLAGILNADPPDLQRTTSPLALALDRVARRCLEKDPARRFQMACDLAFALEALGEVVVGVGAAPGPGVQASVSPSGQSVKSVAVLLFRDLTGNPSDAHLSVGLADSVITELARQRALMVRPTSSILRYLDRSVTPEEAGRELCVDAVLDGAYQRAGSRLRLTLQLVSTAEGRPLWGGKVDASLDDLFAMQDQVSSQVARALQIELTPSDARPTDRSSRPAEGTYECYLKGKVHLLRETLADTNAAIENFKAACDADPDFALAWAGLSDAYARLAFTFDPEEEWYARAEAACERALTLDPGLPEGRYARARLLWSPQRGFDHAGALREVMAALAARPNLGEVHNKIGSVLCHVGLLEEAERALVQALAINPDDLTTYLFLGFCRLCQGRSVEALDISLSCLERAPSAWAAYQTARCQVMLGLSAEAEGTVERAAREFPGDVLFFTLRGLLAAGRGDAARARRFIEQTERNRRLFGHYHHAQVDVGCIHALLGDRKSSLAWLEAAARNGFPCQGFYARDPLLAGLQDEERFAGLLAGLEGNRSGLARLYRELQRAASAGPTAPATTEIV